MGALVQALFELSDGSKKLKEIVAAFPPNSPYWNEAQNRFQFIDRLLIECLGWQHEYMEVENTDELGGRADYLLGHPVKAILEAKREAAVFGALPTGKPTLVRKLTPLIEACKTFDAAVRQVIPYCSIRGGAPIAIVCNGPQLAIFQAIILGQSPLEGECYLFNGFESYITYFPVLWRLRHRIAENRALRELALHRNPRIPPKASTAIPDPTRYRYRSPFQENLRTLSSFLLEEIQDDPKAKAAFYQECYVPIEANNRNLLLSKRIIDTRYDRVAGNGIIPAPIEQVAEVDNRGTVQISDPAFTFALSARPIVVIGDVGVGKTSFFENLFLSLDSSHQANCYFVHINLGIKATLTSDIKSYVLDEIPATLKARYAIDIYEREFLNSIYHNQLNDFDRGIPAGALKGVDNAEYERQRVHFLSDKLSQRSNHLQASLGHLAHGRNKQIILVIDNADQRDFAVQQDAFLIAQELAATRNMLVFVALRPSTFYQSKISGALAGYQNKVFTIAPPPADEVLQRRILFAVCVAEGKTATEALTGIRLQFKSIVLFLHATLRSIRTSRAIRQFLANITGGNTRLVLELFTAFCGSPNIDSEKTWR